MSPAPKCFGMTLLPTADSAWQRQIQRRFDRAAADYVALAGPQRAALADLQARVQADLADWASPTPRQWLDVGAGPQTLLTALLSQRLQDHGVALDLSSSMLLAQPRHPRLHRLCADMRVLPLRTGAFHALVSSFAGHWADEPHGLMRELRRVSAPGARCWLQVPVSGSVLDLPDAGAPLATAETWLTAAVDAHWQVRDHTLRTYSSWHESPAAWLNHVRALGITGRRRPQHSVGLWTRRHLAERHRALEARREAQGIPLHYHVLLGSFDAP